jgi:thiol-disulfide isomerase/thioredoxin
MPTLWITSMLLQWLVIAALCILVLSLVRQLGELSLKLNSVKESTEAVKLYARLPRHDVPTVAGGSFPLGGGRDRPQLVVFFSPTCGACQDLPPALAALAATTPDLDLLLVPSVDRDQLPTYLQSAGLSHLPAAAASDFPEEHRPRMGVPAALALTSDGTVAAKGRPKTLEHLRQMAAAAQHMADLATTISTRQHDWGESAPYWETTAA